MRNHNSLQKELCDVPPVPKDAFSNIEHRIYHKRFKQKIIVSLAVSLLLVAGVLTIVNVHNQKIEQTALADEVIEELDFARNFINGDESYQDSDVLAVIVNDTGD
jgi:hypothetical protein